MRNTFTVKLLNNLARSAREAAEKVEVSDRHKDNILKGAGIMAMLEAQTSGDFDLSPELVEQAAKEVTEFIQYIANCKRYKEHERHDGEYNDSARAGNNSICPTSTKGG